MIYCVHAVEQMTVHNTSEEQINQSNFYSANIPGVARLSDTMTVHNTSEEQWTVHTPSEEQMTAHSTSEE